MTNPGIALAKSHTFVSSYPRLTLGTGLDVAKVFSPHLPEFYLEKDKRAQDCLFNALLAVVQRNS